MPRVRVVSSVQYEEWRAVVARLRREANSKELQRDLRREIRQAGQPALAAARAAVMAVDMSGGPAGSTGLRARTARATRLQVLATGIRFSVRESQVDPVYGRALVRGLEGAPLRHPTFGRRPWTTQTGRPWFYVTLQGFRPQFRAAAEDAMRRSMGRVGG